MPASAPTTQESDCGAPSPGSQLGESYVRVVARKWIILLNVGGISIGLGAILTGIDRIMSGRAVGWIAAGFGLVGIIACLVGLVLLLRTRDAARPPESTG